MRVLNTNEIELRRMSEITTPKKRTYRKAESYIGEVFSRLTVVKITGKNKKGRPIVECKCSCGGIHSVSLELLQSKDTKSCGCLLREQLALPTHLRVATGPKRIESNPEAARARQMRWTKKNPDKVAATARRFRQRHDAKIRAIKAAYFQANKRRITNKKVLRFATDPRFRIEMLLRTRVRKAIQSQMGKKSSATMDLIGCTVDFFLAHIESQFKDGMSWGEIMRGKIHLDHIRPCASFDLLHPAAQLECFNWRNYQPLWKPENLSKSDKLPDGTRGRFAKQPTAP